MEVNQGLERWSSVQDCMASRVRPGGLFPAPSPPYTPATVKTSAVSPLTAASTATLGPGSPRLALPPSGSHGSSLASPPETEPAGTGRPPPWDKFNSAVGIERPSLEMLTLLDRSSPREGRVDASVALLTLQGTRSESTSEVEAGWLTATAGGEARLRPHPMSTSPLPLHLPPCSCGFLLSIEGPGAESSSRLGPKMSPLVPSALMSNL